MVCRTGLYPTTPTANASTNATLTPSRFSSATKEPLGDGVRFRAAQKRQGGRRGCCGGRGRGSSGGGVGKRSRYGRPAAPAPAAAAAAASVGRRGRRLRDRERWARGVRSRGVCARQGVVFGLGFRLRAPLPRNKKANS